MIDRKEQYSNQEREFLEFIVSFRQACMNSPENPGRMGYLNLFRRDNP